MDQINIRVDQQQACSMFALLAYVFNLAYLLSKFVF